MSYNSPKNYNSTKMNYKEIQDLIKLINKTDISEFKLREGEFEITIRTKDYHKGKPSAAAPQQVISVPAPAQVAAIPSFPPAAAPISTESAPKKTESSAPEKGDDSVDNSSFVEIKSPIVGTFYRSASPEKPAYLNVGDRVEVGTVVCIVEAMKLFNEIESELSGKVVKVLIDDASPVEYDQPLFLVDPNG